MMLNYISRLNIPFDSPVVDLGCSLSLSVVLETIAGFGDLSPDEPSPTLQNDVVQRQAVTPRDVLRREKMSL